MITLNEQLSYKTYFLVNVEQVGYYRVLYDDTNWILIANELSHGNLSLIPPKSRAMLIDDASVFVEKGILRFRILLELIKYLEHEVSHTHTELVYLLPHREQESHKIHVEEREHGKRRSDEEKYTIGGRKT